MNLPLPVRGLVEAWYSKRFYAEVGRARGAGLLYLLLSVVLWQLVSATALAVGLHAWIVDAAPRYVNQVPRMVIENGRLSTDVALPYRIADPATGTLWAVIDTTATLDNLPPPPSVVVTSTQVIVRRNAVDTRAFRFATVRHLVIEPAGITSFLRAAEILVPPCLYVFLVVFSWLWNLGAVLFLAFVSLLLARQAPRLDFRARMRLAAAAMTPVIALDVLLSVIHARFGLWWLVSMAIALAYTLWGVRATQAALAAAAAAAGLPPGPDVPAPEPAPAPPPSGGGPA